MTNCPDDCPCDCPKCSSEAAQRMGMCPECGQLQWTFNEDDKE